jgi:hypothetical protein
MSIGSVVGTLSYSYPASSAARRAPGARMRIRGTGVQQFVDRFVDHLVLSIHYGRSRPE